MSTRLLISTSIAALTLVSPGLAADLARVPAPAVPPSAVNYWSGLYLGLSAGVGGGTTDYPISATLPDTLDGVVASGKGHIDGSGWLAGAQIGYNWVLPNRILLGLEADISGSGIRNKLKLSGGADFDLDGDIGSGTAAGQIGTDLDYLGTVRARLGYIVTDPWLVYATGGWAYGRTKSTLGGSYAGEIGGDAGDGAWSASKSTTHNGWALGVGTEYAITPNFSFRAEYLHVDLGAKTVFTYDDGDNVGTLKVDPSYDIVRAGFNYRFGDFGPAPALEPASLAAARGFNWTGLHAGLNAGYGAMSNDYPIGVAYDDGDDSANVAAKAQMRGGGALAGAQIGYDYVLNRMLLGLEADIAWSNVEGKLSIDGSALNNGTYLGSAVGEIGTKLDYLGTLRARLGYVVTDPWMIYATGGWAYGRTKSTASATIDPLFSGSVSKSLDMSGWAAGLGTEYAVTPNFTVRAEYLHVDLGSKTLWSGSDTDWDATLKIKPKFDLVRIGANYKFDF
jgi:outer membrane immunogenic protein